ncbi:hypothetical protein MANES_11G071550v8 [Manihot esculenta]|uniref:Uncharacterized protein n=1 Tax=Manihot esculenta TaxID=3983 RepID=A0ACB7GUF1_MANES|nr:hypothetical protein MANES_11G071550v8 [Manihot esculenta]
MLYTALVEKAGLATSLSTLQPPKETCWKLHGRPTRGRREKQDTSRTQANLVETVETTAAEFLSPNEIQSLKRLLSHIDTSSSSGATSNFVKSGNAFSLDNIP